MSGLIFNNVDDVVETGLCIGCSACMGMCPKGSVRIREGKFGYSVPIKHEECDNCGRCLQECPAREHEYE